MTDAQRTPGLIATDVARFPTEPPAAPLPRYTGGTSPRALSMFTAAAAELIGADRLTVLADFLVHRMGCVDELGALHRLQVADDRDKVPMKLRTALVTARSAPAHERAIRTLMDWHIDVDEAMFLGGLPKGAFLREFEPDFFFDDQTGHVNNAAPHVPAGHVAAGVANG